MPNGSCGKNLTWRRENNTLIISGNGKMDRYSTSDISPAPWDKNFVEKIIIEHGVTTIGEGAFKECAKLTSITIPDSVTEIGRNAFDGCSSLKEIKIPDGVTEIGDWAFGCCESLTEIKIPDGVTEIGDWAFGCCESLTEIKIPDGVTEIYYSTFYGCSSLKEITIPYGLKKLGDEVLDGCASLEKIYYRAGSDFEDILSEGNNATLIPVEKLSWKIDGITLTVGGVSEIKDYSTEKPLWNDYLNSIQKIIIEDGVKSVSANAFSNCIHLEHLKIPSSLKTIGDFAFTFSFCGDRNVNGGKNVFWSLDDGVLLLKKNPDSPPDSDFSVSDVSWKDIEQNICFVKVERGIILNKNFFEWLVGLKNNIPVSF
jgi:hypothetical protein